jgi:uncharacterized repeat protein (TIGR03803 family)
MLRNILTSIIALGALQCSAQYTKLVDFIGMPNGEYPYGDLIHDGTHLYGMTRTGGQENMGNIFRVRTDGSDFSNVFQFSAPGATGIYPNGSLITDGTFLYGMTAMEGATGFTGKGTIFKVAKDGTGYTKLHDFTGYPDGGNPFGSLLLMGSTLYGMTQYGGNEDLGTIFKVNTDGTGYTKLRDLTFGPTNGGYGPWGTLITDGTRLYGMMAAGGIQNCCGTVFSMLPDGTDYSVLHTFDTNDGGQGGPRGALLLEGGVLYGMTRYGGANNAGTVFRLGTDGTGYSTLLEFDTFSDLGGLPSGALITDGDFLYGLSTFGGVDQMGYIFRIGFDGTGFQRLFDFTGQATGREPWGSLILVGGNMYGMTWKGGQADRGVVFGFGSSTDIACAEYTDVLLYPNPAQDQITVEVGSIGQTGALSLKIRSTTGQLISQQVLSTNRTVIPTDDLSIGLYLYELNGTTGFLQRGKLVVR